MRIQLASHLRAIENNTLPIWYARRDLAKHKITRVEYQNIVGDCRNRNGGC